MNRHWEIITYCCNAENEYAVINTCYLVKANTCKTAIDQIQQITRDSIISVKESKIDYVIGENNE